MTQSIMTFTRVVLFGLGVVISSASAADKITLSSTNPTAFDIDYVVAKEKASLPRRISTSSRPT
jgi:hypothetical protein